jgi:hypothetical protein
MQKRFVAGALSCLIALLAAGAVALGTSNLNNGNAPNNDLQDIICDAGWTLPARSTLKTAKQDLTERVVLSFPSAHFYSSLYFAVSSGIPATLGQDLLTFIQQRTT